MHMYAFLHPHPLFLLYIITLVPAALAFTLEFTAGTVGTPPGPNTNFSVTWARTLDSDPQDHFFLIYGSPGDPGTLQDIDEKGANTEQVSLQTKGEGSYFVHAVTANGTKMAGMDFQVSGNTDSGVSSVGSPSSTTASADSRPLANTTSQSSTASSTGTTSSDTTTTTHKNHTSSTSSTNDFVTSLASSADSESSALPTVTSIDSTNSTDPSSLSPDSSTSDITGSTSTSSRPNLGVILGASIGGACLIALLALLFILFRRRQKRNRPVSFHRDMMVRSPGPSLYALSRAASPAVGYPGRVGSPISLNNGRVGGSVPITQSGLDEGSDPGSFTDLLAQASSIAAFSSPPNVPSPLHESGPMLRRENSNPFRDPELMGRLSMHFDNASLPSLHNPPVPPVPSSAVPITPMPQPMQSSQSPNADYASEGTPSPNYSRPHPYSYANNLLSEGDV